METVIGCGALGVIEAEFAFLVDEYGFTLAQTCDVPVRAWYRSPRNSVSVEYDPLGDAALRVELAEPNGETFDLFELLGVAIRDARPKLDVRRPEEFMAEIDRVRRYLIVYCDDFLSGDTPAFRSRYREALMLAELRRIASAEVFGGDRRRAVRLLQAYREYWNDVDRELHERAVEGLGPLSHLQIAR